MRDVIEIMETAVKAQQRSGFDAPDEIAANIAEALTAAGLQVVPAWNSNMEEAPKNKTIRVAWQNSLGNWRYADATYYKKHTLPAASDAFDLSEVDWHEGNGEYYCREGWYGETDFDVGLDWSTFTLGETPTHWKPLPEPPAVQAAKEQGHD